MKSKETIKKQNCKQNWNTKWLNKPFLKHSVPLRELSVDLGLEVSGFLSQSLSCFLQKLFLLPPASGGIHSHTPTSPSLASSICNPWIFGGYFRVAPSWAIAQIQTPKEGVCFGSLK